MNHLKYKLISAVCLSTFALAGCHDDNSSNTTAPTQPMTAISGTAAVGSPIANAQIDLKCNGYSKDAAATTDAQGNWHASIPSANLPCATLLTGGQIGTTNNSQKLYSITTGTGTNTIVNITPLSNLILAKSINAATGTSLENWYTGAGLATSLSDIASRLQDNVTSLLNALKDSGYTVPSDVNFNPFSTAFSAETSNSYDQLLEQFAAAIATSSSATYEGFLASYLAGGTLPTPAMATTSLCESNGADDKLGFKNAPSDFCSFTKASSVAITSPDIYTFFNTDKKENIKVTISGTSVQSIQLENDKYAWACGVGAISACTNASFSMTNGYAQISFQNTVLSAISGTTQDLTIKNGLVIHQNNTATSNVITSTATPFTLSSNACHPLSTGTSPELFDQCNQGVVNDMNLSLIQYTTSGSIPCTLTKSGAVFTVSSATLTVSETLQGNDLNDLLGLNTIVSGVNYGHSLAIKTYGSQEINISFNANNTLKSVIATRTSPLLSIACQPQ